MSWLAAIVSLVAALGRLARLLEALLLRQAGRDVERAAALERLADHAEIAKVARGRLRADGDYARRLRRRFTRAARAK